MQQNIGNKMPALSGFADNCNDLIAIGDIHGQSRLLRGLLTKLENETEPSTRLVFLGDYIDRGPDSKEVIEILLQLKISRPSTVFLRGNHEQMLLDAIAGRNIDKYLANGGEQTIKSYGLSPDNLRAIPEEHLAFLESLLLHYTYGSYFFVHAGIRPEHTLSAQSPEDLLWIRNDFWENPNTFDLKIVFGHTPFIDPLVRHNMIGIDTGAAYGGSLTALLLPSESFISAS